MPMKKSPHHAGDQECENVSPLGRDFNLTTHPCIYYNYVVLFSFSLSLLFPNARIWHHLQQVPTSFVVVISSKHMFMYLVVWYWINYFILLSSKVLIQKVTFTYILWLTIVTSPHTYWNVCSLTFPDLLNKNLYSIILQLNHLTQIWCLAQRKQLRTINFHVFYWSS